MTYDANGNRVTKTGGAIAESITWDGENRPSAIAEGALTHLFTYGPDGHRLKKRVPNGSGGYNETLTLGADLERSPAGIWTKYVHPDVKRVGNGATATPFFHHRDHLASIKVISSNTGAEVKRTVYRPFGDKGTETGLHGESKGFIGERHDPETNLVYLNARYYDPVIAKFVSPDWWDPDKPGVGTNRYAYADNDPVNKADNSGHLSFVAGALIGGAIGAIINGGAEYLSSGNAQAAAAAAGAGFLGGAASGAAAASGFGLAAGIFSSAGNFFGGELAAAAKGEQTTGGQKAASLVGGFISPGASAAAGKGLDAFGKAATNSVVGASAKQGLAETAKEAAKDAGKEAAKSVAGELTGLGVAKTAEAAQQQNPNPQSEPAKAPASTNGESEKE
jgi:RHS repeat-associated protein